MHDQKPYNNSLHSQSSPVSLIKSQLCDTYHSATNAFQECPGCGKASNKINYYSCCLRPSCGGCFSGFHYLECGYAKRGREIGVSSVPDIKQNGNQILCLRCEKKVQNVSYSCKKCRIDGFCEKCFSAVHSKSKFVAHSYKKHSVVSHSYSHSILLCQTHNRMRTLLTETSELICPDCISKTLTKKPKALTFQLSALPQKRQELNNITKSIISQSINHKAKWNEIREQLKDQYHKINRILIERYQQNTQILNQMEDFDMRVVDKAVQECRKVIKESQIEFSHFGIDRDVFVARMAILEQSLMKWKAEIQFNQQFVHKIGTVDSEKLQILLKSFTVSKQKLLDDKENSTRKPAPSLHKNNLSISRRSLSKSISKIDPGTNGKNNRGSALKDSTTSINVSIDLNNVNPKKNINQSVNLNQVKTQPIRNSTPPLLGKSAINSSDKKQSLLRQNSIMSAKIQDITPVLLNFDSKETSGSRINFMSSKTQQQSQHLSLTENDQQASQSRMSKRKSDYFELRDRMRKPNMINNRFNRR